MNNNQYAPQYQQPQYGAGPQPQYQQPQQAVPGQQPQYAPMEKTGVGDIILGFLIPVLGLIFYLLKKDRLSNPEALLYAAGVGAVLDFISDILFWFID